ncbi:serine/threonine-protein kinase MARK2-like [Pteropus vampyrus]|uniref:non-specific serine/threonine protein kinase n=1 Tax=Pteropus vampyrus TaxID=132908 RepID=A0A6P3QJX5_PTEVA|nr:serine/threonine-protein kinase MARK2-like [Pteropus vampyrus]
MAYNLAAISDKEPHIGHYKLLNTIGEGSFAKVRLARHILTGTEVAVKVINRQGSYRPFREVLSLKSLNHPNIVKLFEIIDTEKTLFLIMELVDGGDLYSYLEGCGRMLEHEAQGIFRQLISAVHYCHQRGIIHRDLKPQNILLDADLNVKLADFGLSNEYVGHKLSTFCGSLPYVAPEVFQGRGYHGPGVDVWSLGVILYETVIGKLPFVAEDFRELRKKILKGKYCVPYFITRELERILKKCLTLNPYNRGTLEEIMKDTWINMGQEEELRPYREPPCNFINSQVTQIMRKLGFQQEQIVEAVRGKRYDKTMATYLMLSHKAPKMKAQTITVRSFRSAESFLGSCTPSLTPSIQPSGQEAREPASPTASLEWTTIAPTPRMESGTISRVSRPELRTTTATPRPESGTTTRAPRPESGTATRAPRPESGTATRAPRPESGTATRAPRPESGTATAAPRRESGTATAAPRPESGTATPAPRPESGTATPAPRPESGTATAAPRRESGTATAAPRRESGTATAAPRRESGTATAAPRPESGTATAAPRRESGTATAAPRPESGTATAAPRPESGTATAAPRRESGTATAAPRPESGTATAAPRRESGTATAAPRRESGTATAAPRRESGTATAAPRPESGTATAAPRPESGTATAAPRRESGTATAAPRRESGTATAAPRRESGTATAAPRRESGTTTPVLQPELGNSTSPDGLELKNATPSSASQHGPRGSLSTHTTGSNRAPEGNKEENLLHTRQPDDKTTTSSSDRSQGSHGVARRFLNFVLHFCCRPSFKKRSNKVKPLQLPVEGQGRATKALGSSNHSQKTNKQKKQKNKR